MRFARPELEKDNPPAPQVYVGFRKKRSTAKAKNAAELTKVPPPQDPSTVAEDSPD